MSEFETCSGCAAKFDASRALVSLGVPPFFNMFTAKGVSMLVRCPNCRRQFRSQKVRLFGFVTPNGIGWIILALLVICIAVAAAQAPSL